jgi:putative transposase
MVCIEHRPVRNTSASAAGTIEEPGKDVKAKSGLNQALRDQGWGEFRRRLAYKVASRGRYLVAVPPQNTSRRCPCCGRGSAHNRPTQGCRACVACGFEEHADRIGAVNLSRAGYARSACEVTGAVRPAAGGNPPK